MKMRESRDCKIVNQYYMVRIEAAESFSALFFNNYKLIHIKFELSS